MADGKVVIDVILDDGTVAKGVANIDKQLGGLAGTGKRAAVGIKEIATSLGLVALASKAINMVKQSIDGAISRYDTLNNFPRVLQLMGFDAKQSKKAIDELSNGIDGLPTTLDSVAKTTQRLALITGDLKGATKTTLALNNAFLASGASSADASRGLEQYVQMLSTGTVDLESWKTLQETMPIALNKTAEAFGFAGKSAQRDLYEALKSGEITFEDFNNKLIELNDGVGGFADLARESSTGIRTSWQNVKTAVVKGVADVIGAIDKALGSFGGIAGIFDGLKVGVQTVFNWIVAAIPVVAEWIGIIVDKIREWLPPMDEVKSGFENTFQAIKDFVMPIVQDVVSFIQDVWGGLVSWWQENGEQIKQAVSNAFEFIKSVIEFVMPAVQFIIETVWTAIKDIISGALDVIMGLVQVFTGIFTGDWSKLWEGIKKILSGAVDFISGLMTLQFFGGLKTIFTNLLKSGTGLMQSMWTSIVNFFKNFGSNASATAAEMVGKVIGYFKNLFTDATNVFGQLRTFGASIWNALKEAVIGAARNIWSGVTQHFSNMASSVQNLMHNVKSSIVNIWNEAVSFLKGIDLTQIGKNIIQGLINGIGSMASALWNKVKEITDGIKEKISDALSIHSPSRWMRDMIGKNMMLGWRIGIDKEKSATLKKAAEMSEWMKPSIPEGFTNRLRGSVPLGNIFPGNVSNVSHSNTSIKNDHSKHINVQVQGGYDEREIAKQTEKTIRRMIFQMG
jgi:tape measure domain-containing protein